MVPKVGLVAVAAVVILVPVTSASPNIWGTEEEPELADPPGNVEYSPLYTGPENRHHVDLLAGWFEYLPENDTIMISLKVQEFEDVIQRTEGWSLLYEFLGNMTYEEDDTRSLYISMGSDSDADEFWTRVEIRTSSGDVEVPFDHTIDSGTPGYFRWYVPLDFLLNWGNKVEGFAASAGEFREPTPGVSTIIMNRNPNAFSDAVYSFEGLEPLPVNTTDDEFLTPRSPEPTSTTPAESVAAGLAASAGAILVAVAWRRRT